MKLPMTNKATLTYFTLLMTALVLFSTCSKNDTASVNPGLKDEPADIAVQWSDMTLYTIRFSSFNSPTYASRTLGYIGLTMYECLVHGDSSYRSLGGQLNGLTLPTPSNAEDYQWVLAMNAGMDAVIKLFFPVPDNSHRFVHERIESLY